VKKHNTSSRLQQLLAIVLVLFSAACETEVQLNADYEETTIVYGLVNQSESIHILRVNKSYLGDGNAFSYAGIADSAQYDNVDAVVEEWINNNKVREWTLQDTTIEKNDGLFYIDAVAYFFEADDLDQDATYKLTVRLNEGEKVIRAETQMVRDFSINPPFSFLPEVAWANANSSQNSIYPAVTLEWNSSEYSRRYEVAFRFNYTEFYGPTDSLEKSLTWKVSTQVTDDFEGGELMSVSVEGNQFYDYIKENIAENSSVTRRVVKPMDFYFTVAGDDLHTYMEVNEPINGVIQERPAFTNIDGGIGIFSSRFIKVSTKPMNKNSLRELCQGQFTGALGFCSDSPIYQNEPWYCP